MRNTATIVLLATMSGVAMGGIVAIEDGFVKSVPEVNDPIQGFGEANYVQGFAELSNITLTEEINIQLGDGSAGTLAAGTIVTSHMIYFDPEGDWDLMTVSDIEIMFDGEILGLIVSDQAMVDTHDLLGLAELNYYGGTDMNYGPNGAPDIELFEGSTLNVSLRASQGDYFRVLTTSVPAPGSIALMGLGGLIAGRRKR
jgi:hypothetical protein